MTSPNRPDPTTLALLVLGALVVGAVFTMGGIGGLAGSGPMAPSGPMGPGGTMGGSGTMAGSGTAGGWWSLGGLFGPLTLFVVLVGGGYLVLSRTSGDRREQESATAELRRAYARGDLTDEEFETRREKLERTE